MADIEEEAQSLPATEACGDLLCTILDEIRQAERRKQWRLKQLKLDVQLDQEEARPDKPVTLEERCTTSNLTLTSGSRGCLDKITKQSTNTKSLAKAKVAVDYGKTKNQITGTVCINRSVTMLLVLNCSILCVNFCPLYGLVVCPHFGG